MARRSIVWVKEDPPGAEFADVEIGRGRLSATGVAIGSDPQGYRIDYRLETAREYVTSGLEITARGPGFERRLDLRRLRSGRWTAHGARSDMALLGDAVDCDLALSPLTNSMPVLRHRLLEGGGPIELLMAWVSVPDLQVIPSVQRYRFVRREGELSIIRYESSSRDFIADLSFDQDGLCLTYPGIGRAV
jgi:uncharacterized protein